MLRTPRGANLMKIKQIISLIMLSAIVIGALTGCGTNSLTETSPVATLLSAEEDASLKEDLQNDIDAILNVLLVNEGCPCFPSRNNCLITNMTGYLKLDFSIKPVPPLHCNPFIS